MIDFTVSDLDVKKAKAIGRKFGAKVLSTPKLASSCDIIIVSVPIKKTAQTIREIAPLMKKGAVLIDICSVKSVLKKSFAFAKKFNIEILSIHPLFGPRIKVHKNRKIAIIKIKSGRKSAKFLKFLKKFGFNLFNTTIEEHDKATAVTQALSAQFLRKLIKIADPQFSTTNFDKLLGISKKISANSEFYEELIRNNPNSRKLFKQFLQNI